MLSKFKIEPNKTDNDDKLLHSNLMGSFPLPITKKEHLALSYVKSTFWERCGSKPASNMWSQMPKLTSVQQSKSSEMELSENSSNTEKMLARMALMLICHKSLSAHPHHRVM